MAIAFSPCRQASMNVSITSSTPTSLGRFTVFEIAPEMNGWMAPIMRTCPMGPMQRVPFAGLRAQSNTARCSSFRCGAPSMTPVLVDISYDLVDLRPGCSRACAGPAARCGSPS